MVWTGFMLESLMAALAERRGAEAPPPRPDRPAPLLDFAVARRAAVERRDLAPYLAAARLGAGAPRLRPAPRGAGAEIVPFARGG